MDGNRNYAVLVGFDLTCKVVQKPNDVGLLEFCYDQIGCEFVECVYPNGLNEPYMMVVDEEFLLKNKPMLNCVASYLYETHKHRNPICGNVLIMRTSDYDLELMTLEEANKIQLKLSRLSVDAIVEVVKVMNLLNER